jgi:hypothetical protein
MSTFTRKKEDSGGWTPGAAIQECAFSWKTLVSTQAQLLIFDLSYRKHRLETALDGRGTSA